MIKAQIRRKSPQNSVSCLFLTFSGDFWEQLANFDPYDLWSGGFLYGFFFQKGLFDSTPVHNFIESWFKDRELKQHITIGATNVLNGN